MHDCFGGSSKVIHRTRLERYSTGFSHYGYQDTTKELKFWDIKNLDDEWKDKERSCCNECKIEQFCTKQTMNLVIRSTPDDLPDTYKKLVEIRKQRQVEYTIEKLSNVKRGIMVATTIKNLPENWFDAEANRVASETLAQIKAARTRIEELEIELDKERSRARKLQTANFLVETIVTKKDGVFKCAYQISIEEGEVVPDLSSVQVFSEKSGESNLSALDKALAEEISEKLKKKLKIS